MIAVAGRANYIVDNTTMDGIPDPGAYAVYIAFQAVSKVLG